MWWLWSIVAFGAPGGSSDVPPASVLRPDSPVPLDEANILESVRLLDPTQHQRLVRLKRRDPEQYRTVLRRIARRIERTASDPDALARAVEIRRINSEILALRDRYQATSSGDERVSLRAQMVKKALALMELKQVERRVRLQELQSKLDKLQAEVDQREANKDRLVDEYIDGLLSKP
ncbi:MAG: hypothetical protein AAGA48_31035 [Myxococcota bacterium]